MSVELLILRKKLGSSRKSTWWYATRPSCAIINKWGYKFRKGVALPAEPHIFHQIFLLASEKAVRWATGFCKY
jgi:hypothetical protein